MCQKYPKEKFDDRYDRGRTIKEKIEGEIPLKNVLARIANHERKNVKGPKGWSVEEMQALRSLIGKYPKEDYEIEAERFSRIQKEGLVLMGNYQ